MCELPDFNYLTIALSPTWLEEFEKEAGYNVTEEEDELSN